MKIKKKLPITHFTISQLIKQNMHIGFSKNLRNTTNINYIYSTPQNMDIINLYYTLKTLRIILPAISKINSENGKILTIFNTNYIPICYQFIKANMEYHQRFLFAWKPGLLSNFKEFRKQKKFYYYKNLWHIPNFIISVTSEYHNDFKTEVKALDIPCAKIQDTAHKNFNFLYTLPANTKHTSSSLFFIALIQTALATGFTKKILTFSTKKFKT